MSALLLAAAAGVFYAVSSVLQHRALVVEMGLASRRWVGVVQRSRWWYGVAADVLGLALETVALARGSLVAVEAIVACGLPVAVSMGRPAGRRLEDVRALAWLGLVVVGLVAFLAAVPSTSPSPAVGAPPVVTTAVFATMLAGGVTLVATDGRRARPKFPLAERTAPHLPACSLPFGGCS